MDITFHIPSLDAIQEQLLVVDESESAIECFIIHGRPCPLLSWVEQRHSFCYLSRVPYLALPLLPMTLPDTWNINIFPPNKVAFSLLYLALGFESFKAPVNRRSSRQKRAVFHSRRHEILAGPLAMGRCSSTHQGRSTFISVGGCSA